MSDAETESALVAALYESAIDQRGWSNALHLLARYQEADNFHFMVWNSREPRPLLSSTWGMDERVEAEYQSHYGALDPRRLLASQLPDGDWFACQHYFEHRDVQRSEFFQDYLIPGGCRYLLGAKLLHRDELDIFFGMHRAPGRDPFDAPEIQRMRRITGHFQRAARLWLATEELRTRTSFGQQALDAIETGIVGLDGAGRVAYANRYADTLLREGRVVKSRLGVLTAVERVDATRLADAWRKCLQDRYPTTVSVGSRDALERYTLTFVVPPIDESLGLLNKPALIVLIAPGKRRRMATIRQLMQLYGLTPAEARLARAIAANVALHDYAEQSGISLTTVKTQLRAVFEKTNTSRQTDLAVQVALIPAARRQTM